MKKTLLLLLSAFAVAAQAQISVPEPDFVNSYCIITSETTYATLPKENGTIGEHKTKSKGLLGKIGGVADVVSSVGVLGTSVGVATGNYGGAVTAIKAASVASSVSGVAGTTNALTNSVGLDLIFAGANSPYVATPDADGIKILIKAEANNIDPRYIYRIVRFSTMKKERRFQWFEIASGAFDTPEVQKGGFVSFEGRKYGETSYILSIPVAALTPGEYGVVYMDIATATSVPVGTFGIR